ncbi:MAG: signal recognition particle protein, partial [Lachnospiraceae bacterium]|nr:signal recognition particle protein [Lachnospiraceae bacterium]
KALARTVAIIRSMTKKERTDPDILNASRRKRIAAGSGTTVQEVNRLINGFESARKMMKQLTGRKFRKGHMGGLPFGF